MLHENEVVMLLLGVGIFLFMLMNISHIRHISFWKILIASYSLLLTGWILTVLEGYFLESLLNFLEHLSYAMSSLVLAVWCFKVFGDIRKEGQA
jgi:hypothetical protein